MSEEIGKVVIATAPGQRKRSRSPNEDEKVAFNDAYQKHVEKMEQRKATEYQRLRAAEYPSIVDQLDAIFHKGLDGWKLEIQEIKDKYPKPE
jgi:hypothetical protein